MNQARKRLALLAAVATLTIMGSAARADKDDAPILDRDFAAQTITAAKADARLCELAAKQATDDKVKELAQKVLKEDNALADRLTDASRDLMIGLDYELEKAAKANWTRLSNLQGAEFDREFMKLIVDNHVAAVNRMEREVRSGTNAAIKAVAEESVKHFKDNLKDARSLLDAVKDKKD
jgi:putative membrane protein